MSSEERLRKSPLAAASDSGEGFNGSSEREELARARIECERLSERVRQLEKERDGYRQALYASEVERITESDLQQYARQEGGLPLEAFLDELKGLAKGNPP